MRDPRRKYEGNFDERDMMLPDGSIGQFPCSIDLFYFAQWLTGRRPRDSQPCQSSDPVHHQCGSSVMDIRGPHAVPEAVYDFETVIS